jgi:hypothetical protein
MAARALVAVRRAMALAIHRAKAATVRRPRFDLHFSKEAACQVLAVVSNEMAARV